MYQFDKAEPSYWEATGGELLPHASTLTEASRCEVAIIGGGYTGLSAAYHLCRDFQIDARVLEAGHIGWGASGRNGGFCSMGGTSLGPAGLLQKYGETNTRHYYDVQRDAVLLVKNLLLEENIDAHIQGDSELEVACSRHAYDRLNAGLGDLVRALGIDAKVAPREQVREQYFDFPLQHGAMVSRPTFGLHPLRFVRGLADAAVRRGAILHDFSEVRAWSKKGAWHTLSTAQGSLRARFVILATNGFTPENLHPVLCARTLPLISSIIVTRPLSDAELEAHAWQAQSPAFTSFNLLDYFRVLPDKRLLLGGRGSSDGSKKSAQKNFMKLVTRLGYLFPEWREVDVDYQWHGLVCLNRRLTPAVGRFADDPSTMFAFGYHGNGVNNATWCGRQVARWLGRDGRNGGDVPASLPHIMHGMPSAIPLPSLRLKSVQARIAAFRLSDWWKNRT